MVSWLGPVHLMTMMMWTESLVMARDGGHRGQLARASALDDDDDVD